MGILKLKKYQKELSNEISKSIRDGLWSKAKENKLEATLLKAITGAGKTIILSDVINTIEAEDRDDYCVFWVSYSPSINEQSKKKLEKNYPHLANKTVTLDSSNYLNDLQSQFIYFLNYSKLGQSSNMSKGGADSNNKSFWDLDFSAKKIILIADEVQIGGSGASKEITTILGNIIKILQPKYILAASATPENFEDFLVGLKLKNPYSVDIQEVSVRDVANTNIIKANLVNVTLDSPWSVDEKLPQDLLKNALDRYIETAKIWESLGQREKPILLIQVDKKFEEQSELKTQLLDTILSINSPYLTEDCIFHTIPGVRLGVDLPNNESLVINSIEPNDIQDNDDVRVVIFKDNLSIGWDCPRAEILFSVKSAKKDTSIVQVLGRIIRNPFINNLNLYKDNEALLSSAYFYSPNFCKDVIDEIVSEFSISTETKVLGNTESVLLDSRVEKFFLDNPVGHSKSVFEKVGLAEKIIQVHKDFSNSGEDGVLKCIEDVFNTYRGSNYKDTFQEDLELSLKASIQESVISIKEAHKNKAQYAGSSEKKEFTIIKNNVDSKMADLSIIKSFFEFKGNVAEKKSFYAKGLGIENLEDILKNIWKKYDYKVNFEREFHIIILNYLLYKTQFIKELNAAFDKYYKPLETPLVNFSPVFEESYAEKYWNVLDFDDKMGKFKETEKGNDVYNFLVKHPNVAYFKNGTVQPQQPMKVNSLEVAFLKSYILKEGFDYFWRNPSSSNGLGIRYEDNENNPKIFRPDFLAIKGNDLYVLESKADFIEWEGKYEGVIEWAKNQKDFKGNIYNVWCFSEGQGKSAEYYLVLNASKQLIKQIKHRDFKSFIKDPSNHHLNKDGYIKLLSKED